MFNIRESQISSQTYGAALAGVILRMLLEGENRNGSSKIGLASFPLILEQVHPDLASTKLYSLCRQPKPLLHAALAWQQDPAAGAHYPVPGNTAGVLQRPYYLPGPSWKPRSRGHSAISRYLPSRYFSRGCPQFFEHSLKIQSTHGARTGSCL